MDYLRRLRIKTSELPMPSSISGSEPGSGTPCAPCVLCVPPLSLLHAATCLSSASPSHFGRGCSLQYLASSASSSTHQEKAGALASRASGTIHASLFMAAPPCTSRTPSSHTVWQLNEPSLNKT